MTQLQFKLWRRKESFSLASFVEKQITLSCFVRKMYSALVIRRWDILLNFVRWRSSKNNSNSSNRTNSNKCFKPILSNRSICLWHLKLLKKAIKESGTSTMLIQVIWPTRNIFFITYIDKSVNIKIKMGNGVEVFSLARGIISISTILSIKYIPDVLLVPCFSQTLLSVGQMVTKGYALVFKDNSCTIFD